MGATKNQLASFESVVLVMDINTGGVHLTTQLLVMTMDGNYNSLVVDMSPQS